MNKKTMTAGLLTCALLITCALSVSAQEAKAQEITVAVKAIPATEIVKITPINESIKMKIIPYTEIQATSAMTEVDMEVVAATELRPAILVEDGTVASEDSTVMEKEIKMIPLTPAK